MISRLRDAGIYRWIRAHQFAHFCCVICWSALFPIRSNTLARHCCWLRPASARMFREFREFQLECEEAPNVVWSHSSSSYGLARRGWKMGNMAATWPRGIYLGTPVEQRCWDVAAPSKMMKTSSLIGTRGAKMTTNSLMKAWKVAHRGLFVFVRRDRSLFDNVVIQTHVGRYGKRDVNVSSAWSYDATDSFA